MFNQCRMVLLGLIVAQGANLVAMDSPKKGGNLSDSGKKAVAAVQVLANADKNSLKCSAELRKEEVGQSVYYEFRAGFTPVYSSPHYKYDVRKDRCPLVFPH